MAGGEGPLMRRCSTTKRKASGKEAASGRTPRPRASSGSKTKEETPAAGAGAGPGAENAAAAGAKQKRRLPAKDVRRILAQKLGDPPETYEALRRSNPALVPRPEEEGDEELKVLYLVARAFYAVQVRIPKLQAWVRGELEEKGYVEVDDDWFKRKADAQATIDREWPRIRAIAEGLVLEDGGGDESDSDSDEEEGEDEMPLDSVKNKD